MSRGRSFTSRSTSRKNASAALAELTVRELARRSAISERTIFRYFATREELLDAVAQELVRRMDLPPHPASVEELFAAPRALYARFEAAAGVVRAALHTELFHRMRTTQAQERWVAVRKVVDRTFPHASARERKLVAANVRYYLAASTWHYYRTYFGFSLEDAIASAELAIRQAVAALRSPRRTD